MENQLVVREVATARDALQASKNSRFSQFLVWSNDSNSYNPISVDEIWKWARSKGPKDVRARLGSMKLMVEFCMPWRS